jgi:Domain of unknown function (DUF5666)
MSTLTFDRRANPDGIEDDDEGRMPRRPRRRLLTRWSAVLLAAMTCAIGFYVGVRVEKGHIASTPSTAGATGASGFAAALSGRTGGSAASGSAAGGSAAGGSAAGGSAAGGSAAGGSAAGGSAAGGASSTGGASAAGASGFAARFGGGGNATFGTVASVDGKTLTLTEASGDTVKVKLTSATKISKTESAKRSQIHPGDTITVSGVTSKQGTVSAATVPDSGARTTGSSSSTGGSGSSGVSSLFSGG